MLPEDLLKTGRRQFWVIHLEWTFILKSAGHCGFQPRIVRCFFNVLGGVAKETQQSLSIIILISFLLPSSSGLQIDETKAIRKLCGSQNNMAAKSRIAQINVSIEQGRRRYRRLVTRR